MSPLLVVVEFEEGKPRLMYGMADETIIVATTRPETMLGDTAIAVHPDDPRYTVPISPLSNHHGTLISTRFHPSIFTANSLCIPSLSAACPSSPTPSPSIWSSERVL